MSEEIPEPDAFYMQMPAEIREMIDHQRMHAETSAHETRDFLEDLDEGQLRKFRGILSVFAGHPESVPYYMGLIGGLLATKYNLCLACSKNHDKDLEEMTGSGEKHEHVVAPPPDEPSPAEEAAAIADRQISMHEYGVELVSPGDWYGQVICNGPCEGANGGATWKDLEERMKSPQKDAGCNYCQQKAAWG